MALTLLVEWTFTDGVLDSLGDGADCKATKICYFFLFLLFSLSYFLVHAVFPFFLIVVQTSQGLEFCDINLLCNNPTLQAKLQQLTLTHELLLQHLKKLEHAVNQEPSTHISERWRDKADVYATPWTRQANNGSLDTGTNVSMHCGNACCSENLLELTGVDPRIRLLQSVYYGIAVQAPAPPWCCLNMCCMSAEFKALSTCHILW